MDSNCLLVGFFSYAHETIPRISGACTKDYKKMTEIETVPKTRVVRMVNRRQSASDLGILAVCEYLHEFQSNRSGTT